jgi:hypothetical protein
MEALLRLLPDEAINVPPANLADWLLISVKKSCKSRA